MSVKIIQTMEEAIEWIHNLKTLGIKPGLARMEYIMERLDHPERHVKFVHVAGTNGKGSTVSFISEVLKRSGYTVGTFTSPYLIHFTNRIQVNGEDISGEDLVQTLNQIIPIAKELEESELGAPTEFEVVTAIAILYFAKVAYPDVVIWETGLGGRLDSTNIVHPILSVITSIGYDHMDLLGDTIEAITFEKAGIIKPGVPVISGVEQEEAIHVIKQVAAEKRATVYQMNERFSVQTNKMTAQGSEFNFEGIYSNLSKVEIKMQGPHQVKNAGVALMAIEILRQFYAFIVEEEGIRNGMRYTFWPGRFEKVLDKPLTIIDGAHNPQGAASLVDTIKLYDYNRLIVVTGILKDKAVSDFLQIIAEVADQLIITEPDNPRAARVEEIGQLIEGMNLNIGYQTVSSWQEAIDTAMGMAESNDLLMITGSLYLISDARRYIVEKKKN